jgi:hypothetical protein
VSRVFVLRQRVFVLRLLEFPVQQLVYLHYFQTLHGLKEQQLLVELVQLFVELPQHVVM